MVYGVQVPDYMSCDPSDPNDRQPHGWLYLVEVNTAPEFLPENWSTPEEFETIAAAHKSGKAWKNYRVVKFDPKDWGNYEIIYTKTPLFCCKNPKDRYNYLRKV